MSLIKKFFNPKYTKVLAIETSCDDTSLSIVEYKDWSFQVLRLHSFSQIELHQKYGGVMPEIAYRSHAEKIITMLDPYMTLLQDSIDAIVVTATPGLPGSLIVGITTAYLLWNIWKKPVIETHHILGHVFSILCDRSLDILQFPYLCLTASGGHNDLYLVEQKDSESLQASMIWDPQWWSHNPSVLQKRGHLELHLPMDFWPFMITKLAQTCDDASGECFDKVARMLGGPYPWWKRISDLASHGNYDPTMQFHAGSIAKQPLMFSYSWLKSQIAQYIKQSEQSWIEIDDDEKAAIAYNFQETICSDLCKKLDVATQLFSIVSLWVCGWVSANKRLQQMLVEKFWEKKLYFPLTWEYCTDNAAMIGVAGLIQSHH